MTDKLQQLSLATWVNAANPMQRGFREAVHIVLTAISTSAALRSKMIMKGGLLMAIRYGSTRYTKDVDFSTHEPYTKAEQEILLTVLDAQLELANDQLSYDTLCRRQTTRLNPPRESDSFPTLELAIGYAPRSQRSHLTKLLAGQSPTVVGIDYSYNEAVYEVDLLSLTDGLNLQTYCVSSLIAEKIRALLQQPGRRRNRRQDVYDLHLLLTSCVPFTDYEREQVLTQMLRSCQARQIEARRKSMRDPLIKAMASSAYDELAHEIESELTQFDQAYALVQSFYETLPWPTDFR